MKMVALKRVRLFMQLIEWGMAVLIIHDDNH